MNGSLDNSFGQQGEVTTGLGSTLSLVLGFAVKNNGKLVVAGSSIPGPPPHNRFISSNNRFTIDQYNSNREPDSTFGLDGEVHTIFLQQSVSLITSLTIQQDNKIVADGFAISVSGQYDFVLARYNDNGNLDSTFGKSGIDTLNTLSNFLFPGHGSTR